MHDPVDALVLDLLEWIGPGARPYPEVMEAWRTSCPRLPVWEEANARGQIDRRHEAGRGVLLAVSERGRAHLQAARPAAFSCRPRAAAEPGDGPASRRRP
jgi:hypothetical protein